MVAYVPLSSVRLDPGAHSRSSPRLVLSLVWGEPCTAGVRTFVTGEGVVVVVGEDWVGVLGEDATSTHSAPCKSESDSTTPSSTTTTTPETPLLSFSGARDVRV